MSAPRNVAHDKKVQDEKKHHGEAAVPGAVATPQPGKKPALAKDDVEGETYQQHAQQSNLDEQLKAKEMPE